METQFREREQRDVAFTCRHFCARLDLASCQPQNLIRVLISPHLSFRGTRPFRNSVAVSTRGHASAAAPRDRWQFMVSLLITLLRPDREREQPLLDDLKTMQTKKELLGFYVATIHSMRMRDVVRGEKLTSDCFIGGGYLRAARSDGRCDLWRLRKHFPRNRGQTISRLVWHLTTGRTSLK